MDIRINHESRTPKYKQIINEIEQLIERGHLKLGDKIPSINAVAERYILSRDTVEKAYLYLKDQNVITSVRGKGYFVTNTDLNAKLKVCLLMNKLSAYKKIIYDNFVRGLGNKAQVDLFLHHCDVKIFEYLTKNILGHYSFYVIMPHFETIDDQVLSILNQYPEKQLLILDRRIENLQLKKYGAVYQDFENDIFDTLSKKEKQIQKYDKIHLVFPVDEEYPYPKEIVRGFTRFCGLNKLDFHIINEIDEDKEVHKGELYIIIDEADLVNIIKICRSKGYKVGTDIGVISYNETALKEVLENGITVISTDFINMGRSAAEMILKEELGFEKNPFKYLDRGSF